MSWTPLRLRLRNSEEVIFDGEALSQPKPLLSELLTPVGGMSIPAGNNDYLPFAPGANAGNNLLDVAAPTSPETTVRGVYVVTAVVTPTVDMAVGAQYRAVLTLSGTTFLVTSEQTSPPATAAVLRPSVSLAVGQFCPTHSILRARVFNLDALNALDVKLATIGVATIPE